MTFDEWLEILPDHDFTEIAALELIERFSFLHVDKPRLCFKRSCKRHGFCLGAMVFPPDKPLPVPFTQANDGGLRPACMHYFGRLDYKDILKLKTRLLLETSLLEHPFLLGNHLRVVRDMKREERARRKVSQPPSFNPSAELSVAKSITDCLRSLDPPFMPPHLHVKMYPPKRA